jgi:hypothetical protein
VKVFLKPRQRKVEIDTSGLMLKVNNLAAGPWSSFGENMKVSEVPITGTPIRKWMINAGLEGRVSCAIFVNKDQILRT